MSADATGLDRLHDIIVPAPAPWWPPAPGWYWVIGMVSLIGAVLLWRALVHWQRNCYRRDALAELVRIEAQIEALIESAAATPQVGGTLPQGALPAMAELLKRTALTAYPREQVAALTGPAWFAFLDQTGGTNFNAGLGAILAHGNYLSDNSFARSGDFLTPDSLKNETDGAYRYAADIAAEIRCWIKQHGNVDDARPERTPTDAHQPTLNKSSAAEAG